MKTVYCDNAATTAVKPKNVSLAVSEVLASNHYGNPARGTHEFSLHSYREVSAVREKIRRLMQASQDYEVVFTNNATASLNMVIKGLFHSGDRVLTTAWEHNAVLRPLYQLEKTGVILDFVSSSPQTGQLDYSEFEEKITPETKAVIVNHASNVIGNVLDLDRVKDFCRKHQLYLIVDVSQSLGQIPVDLSDGAITAVCFTGHKSLYGPMGTGGICIKKEVKLDPLITGGDGVYSFEKEAPAEYPALLEAGTLNVPGIVGLGAGLDYIFSKTPQSITNYLDDLQSYFLAGLKQIGHIEIYGDLENRRIPVFSVNLTGAASDVVSNILWEDFGIATRSGFHCAPLIHQALHTEKRGAVRFSFSSFNTREELDYCLDALKEISRR